MGLTPAQVTEIDLAADKVRTASLQLQEVGKMRAQLNEAHRKATEASDRASIEFYATVARVTGIVDVANEIAAKSLAAREAQG